MNTSSEQWWAKWVGRRAPDDVTAPCWWMVRDVYARELGIELPEEGTFAPKSRWARLLQAGMTGRRWERVAPVNFAVAVARIGSAWHVGVVAEDIPAMLLSTADRVVVAQRLDRYLSAGAVRGCFAYRQAGSGTPRGSDRVSTSTPRRGGSDALPH